MTKQVYIPESAEANIEEVGKAEWAPPPEPTEFVTLPLKDVRVNPDENCRQRTEKPDEWEEFVNNIRAHGLQQPPGVQWRKKGRGGAYHLVFGFRRYRALLELYGPDAAFQFVDFKGSQGDARLINLTENTARKDLAPFEMAESLAWQKRHNGLTSKELAEKTGIVANYVDTLIRLKEKLHPDLWKTFVELGARAPVKTFIKCLSKEDQVEYWNRLQGEKKAKQEARKAKQARESGDIVTHGREAKPAGDGKEGPQPGNPLNVPLPPDPTDEPEPPVAWVEPAVVEFDERCARLLTDAENCEDEDFANGIIMAVQWLKGEGDYPFEG